MSAKLSDNVPIICVRWGVTPPKIINTTKIQNMHTDSKKHITPTDANNVLAGRCFLAMFENGNEPFYLANWEGDPGRTLLKVNAKQFRTQSLAEKAIKKAVQKYPQRNLVGKVVEYNAR